MNLDLIGLPESGKSTFLAALWFLLTQHGDEMRWEADLKSHDSEYLDLLVQQWLQYKPFGRTITGEDIHIGLRSKATGRSVDLLVPDVAGDRLLNIWVARGAMSIPDSAVDGYLLFLNPLVQNRPSLLDGSVQEVVAELTGKAVEVANAVPLRPWEPAKSPAQVQLVYLLQSLDAALGSCPTEWCTSDPRRGLLLSP